MTIKVRAGSQSLRTAESMLAQAGCQSQVHAFEDVEQLVLALVRSQPESHLRPHRLSLGAVLSRSELDG
jgi:hypothetical protein